MDRRRFIASTGAAALALKSEVMPAAPTPGKRALMKVGDQNPPTNEARVQYLARYGVRNISS